MLSPDKIIEIQEQAYVGAPSSFLNICKVYPLTLYEIIEMGSSSYNAKLGLLLLNEISIAEIIKEKTGEDIAVETIQPLSYLLQNALYDNRFLLELQSCFSTFIKEEVLLLPKINSVLIGSPKEKRLITNDNFADFQDILRIQNKKEVKEAPPENESEIARKFRLKREQRDAAKRKQQAKTGEGQTLAELLEIAETFGIDYKNKTIYCFYNLLKRHQAKEKWDQDIRMLCAGADSKKLKTKYWGESLKDK